jgi:squalene-hopene/tetraprenyl-beta-curcumene cyclase
MQTQDKSLLTRVQETITKSQNYLLSQQQAEGYWWVELESNITMAAEVLLLHKIWGTAHTRPLHKIETYLRKQQRDHGGWELFYGDGGELSTTVEGYMAMRLLGVPQDDPALVKAREFILDRGGISKSRIFTKMHLALVGCYNWRGLPSIPPWIMLLPQSFPIYEMSSWARGSTVPLILLFDKKPVYQPEPGFNLNELYAEGIENVKYELPRNNDWSDIFVTLDDGFKFAENLNLVPWREEGLKAAEKWVLERQEATGDWGGIIPAMLNSLLGLHALGYDVNDPIIVRGLEGIDRFAIETEDEYWVQPCVSPVWDTALAMRGLADSGLDPQHPALVKGGEWLLDKQILDYGDWSVKNKAGMPGAWAFEFENRFYPDVDDSAVVVMALSQVKLPDKRRKKGAIARTVKWIETMQCTPGGWGAFDKDNNADWLNDLPYGDLKAMIDPNTADVTARVLEMVGRCDITFDSQRLQRGIRYLEAEQEPEGCWFGRWGVNYIYGTSGVLSALCLVAPDTHQTQIKKAAQWLLGCQNDDGGWGETCFTYNDRNLMGQGDSTPSQTAWALTGLMSTMAVTDLDAKSAIDKGISYLIETQRPDGTWNEDYFTGTGFPGHFYLKYHLYQQHFPLTALGRYQQMG